MVCHATASSIASPSRSMSSMLLCIPGMLCSEQLPFGILKSRCALMSDIPEEPKKSARDVAYTVVKAADSGVPIVGGPAAELLGLVFGSRSKNEGKNGSNNSRERSKK